MDQTIQPIDLYVPGVEVWLPDESDGWVLMRVQEKVISDGAVKLTLTTSDSIAMNTNAKRKKSAAAAAAVTDKNGCLVLEISLAQDSLPQLPHLRNPALLDGIEDLTGLNYLHEPGVLQCLRYRYSQKTIYTYSGIVLIAVNPFARVPLYGPEIVKAYSGRRKGELEPHLFAIAEDAFRCMTMEDNRNQAIIVSGESGSGKTVSAKYIMRYLATVVENIDQSSSTSKGTSSSASVEEQVIATNPLMEAFGNAKTTRNDNSSRFGKFIEINFFNSGGNKYEITGATVRTYLLERSRVIFQSESERNYHIFYQLCSGAPAAERKELHILASSEFAFLKQGKCLQIDGVDDAKDFELTQKAMSTIGMAVQMQWKIFRILSAILHLGNIEIKTMGASDASTISETDVSLMVASDLLGIPAKDLINCIVRKKISTRSESIVTNNNPSQANYSRLSLSKYIYSVLFDWLVGEINASLSPGKKSSSFISVLDIYGFEHFTKNSFEQFCINYANEKLQQEFNRHVFKLEQELYVREEIAWSFIDFNDNQPCIELIEGKLGLLDLLDEECRMPSGNDGSFATKILKAQREPAISKFFGKPRFGSDSFIVHHFAYSVTYDVDGFVDKNRDTIGEEQLMLLQNSSFAFCRDLFAPLSTVLVASGTRKGKQTLGAIFKGSLAQLMDTINSTNAHYIRCIKPNEAKVPDSFDNVYILQQLRACGILETIRISCAGYPGRWSYAEFNDRYKIILHSKDRSDGPAAKAMAIKILEQAKFKAEKYQAGKSRIFFRAGQLAYLEKIRGDRLVAASVVIQKYYRRHSCQKRYQSTRQFIVNLQTAARRSKMKGRFQRYRQHVAAVKIQCSCRRFLHRKPFLAYGKSIRLVQGLIRRALTRSMVASLKRERAVVKIQSVIRKYLEIRWARKFNRRVTLLQCQFRRKMARKALSALRTEARSLNHIREVKYQLENKVIELTQLLQSQKDVSKLQREQIAELSGKLEHKGQDLQDALARLDRAKRENATLIGKLQVLEEALVEKDREIMRLRDANNHPLADSQDLITDLMHENERLRDQLANSKAPNASEARVEDIDNIIATTSLTEPPDRNPRRHTFSGKEVAKNALIKLLNPLEKIPSNPGSFLMTPVNMLSAMKRPSISSSEGSPKKEETPVQSPIKSPMASYSSQEFLDLLLDSRLEKEIWDGFITASQVYGNELVMEGVFEARGAVLVTSHIVAFRYLSLWRLGQVDRSHAFLSSVLKTVEAQVIKRIEATKESEYDVSDGFVAFWIVNLVQLWISLYQAKHDANRPRLSNSSVNLGGLNSKLDYDSMEKSLAQEVSDLGKVASDRVFQRWLKELCKRHEKSAISALLDHQGLGGYVSQAAATRFFGFRNDSAPSVSIESFVSSMQSLLENCNRACMDAVLKRSVFLHLFTYLSATCFNQLLMRKNFLSWKRGVQIQFNVTRLQQWCTQNGMEEVSLCLEKLAQTAKLLQLAKKSAEDVELIFDACFLLNPSQIKKIISLYQREEFEEAIAPEVIQAVAKRSVLDQETLFLDTSIGSGSSVLKLESLSKGPSSFYTFPKKENFHYNLMNVPHIKNMFEAAMKD